MENSKQPINPIAGSHEPLHPKQLIGLTKREYFAAMAMQGLISDPSNDELSPDFILMHLGLKDIRYDYPKHFSMYIAKLSVEYADALLKELEEQN